MQHFQESSQISPCAGGVRDEPNAMSKIKSDIYYWLFDLTRSKQLQVHRGVRRNTYDVHNKTAFTLKNFLTEVKFSGSKVFSKRSGFLRIGFNGQHNISKFFLQKRILLDARK